MAFIIYNKQNIMNCIILVFYFIITMGHYNIWPTIFIKSGGCANTKGLKGYTNMVMHLHPTSG